MSGFSAGFWVRWWWLKIFTENIHWKYAHVANERKSPVCHLTGILGNPDVFLGTWFRRRTKSDMSKNKKQKTKRQKNDDNIWNESLTNDVLFPFVFNSIQFSRAGTLPPLVGTQIIKMHGTFPEWVTKAKMTERSGPSSYRLCGGSEARND